MANFFSVDFWKALYFKAMGGQATAVDPNAMRGTFAGSSTFTGTLELPVGFIAGSFAGTSTFVGTATNANPDFYTIDADGLYWERRRKRQERHTESVLDDIEDAIRAVLPETDVSQVDLPPVITQPLTTTERDAVADKVVAANRQLQRDEIDRLILQTEAALLQRAKELQAEDDEIIMLLLAA